ncbi:hypothetical protein GA0061103_1609 [Rhizobium multihospitium]|uniref:Uncharacterized protein n=1 Tax=Rhizobium multihospitium TaxID=410764 RepID=A0A1C3U6C7_9HYPH|nr:hypothetical protein GA0061103_1609 [Rhizobium multihospitium]
MDGRVPGGNPGRAFEGLYWRQTNGILMNVEYSFMLIMPPNH